LHAELSSSAAAAAAAATVIAVCDAARTSAA